MKRDLDCTYLHRGQFYGPGQGVEVPETFRLASDRAKPAAVPGDLPEDFPHRSALVAGGFGTLNAVRDAADADLLALPRFGDAALAKVRAAQAEA